MIWGIPDEKLHLAVGSLATSPASLQQRIAKVFISHLYGLLDIGTLPPTLDAKFKAYPGAWNKIKGSPPEGLIQAWAQSLTNDEAVEVARRIVDAHDEVQGLLEEESHHRS